MKHSRIERLLDQLQQFRIFSLLLQVVLMILLGWLSWSLFHAVRNKYLLEIAIPWAITTAAILLLLFIRSMIVFQSRKRNQFARLLDQKYQLKNRIATYIELKDSEHPFLPALEHETEKNLSGISVLHAGNWERGTIVPLLIGLALMVFLFCLPFLPVSASVQARKTDQWTIQKEARILENKIKTLQKENPRLPDLQKALEELRKLSQEMQKPGLEKAEALKRLNSMQEHLEKLQKDLVKSRQKAIQAELQNALKNSKATGSTDPAIKEELDQLTKKLQDLAGKGSLAEQALKDAASSGRLSKEQAEKMKKALEKYQKEMTNSEKRLAEMKEALGKTRKGISSGKPKVTADSRIRERDLEKSKGGVEDGPGTTNQDAGPQSFDTKKKGKGEYIEDRTKAKYEDIYKGRREKTGSEEVFLNPQWNDSSDPKHVPVRSFGLDSQPEVVGENNLSPTSQSDEESEIKREKIPASYQKIVQEYFESIQEN